MSNRHIFQSHVEATLPLPDWYLFVTPNVQHNNNNNAYTQLAGAAAMNIWGHDLTSGVEFVAVF